MTGIPCFAKKKGALSVPKAAYWHKFHSHSAHVHITTKNCVSELPHYCIRNLFGNLLYDERTISFFTRVFNLSTTAAFQEVCHLPEYCHSPTMPSFVAPKPGFGSSTKSSIGRRNFSCTSFLRASTTGLSAFLKDYFLISNP
ncbi:hypothetical protein TNCV_3493851 [Trichonephila clavipes]|nr:hypothetical protein TNCV_3493851 [Trichonephila clavipes]